MRPLPVLVQRLPPQAPDGAPGVPALPVCVRVYVCLGDMHVYVFVCMSIHLFVIVYVGTCVAVCALFLWVPVCAFV